MKIRKYENKYLLDIINLFYDTVHQVNIKDYTLKQVDTWAPKEIDKKDWESKLKNNYTILVFKENSDKLIGFGMATEYGLIDYLYIDKDHQRIGIATIILDDLENYIKTKTDNDLYVEASITAKPFFEKNGYTVIKTQEKELRNVIFLNYLMQKSGGKK